MSKRKSAKSERQGGRKKFSQSGPGVSEFLLGCAGLLVLVFAAYWPVLHGGFVWDDDFMLTNNPAVKSPAGLRYIWFTTALPDYFPLTSTSLWLEWKLWGMKAWGYHITNV